MYSSVLDKKENKRKQVTRAVEVVCFYCVCIQHAFSVGNNDGNGISCNLNFSFIILTKEECSWRNLIRALLHQPPPHCFSSHALSPTAEGGTRQGVPPANRAIISVLT